MKIYTQDKIYVTERIMTPLKGRHLLSLGAVSLFPLNEEGPRKDELPLDIWQRALDRISADAVIDECFPKERAEFLVYGAAVCPNELSRQSKVSVKVSVGALSKHLSVTGEREFMGAGLISAATPFKEMPLTWANTFGGSGFSENVEGKGLAPVYNEALKRDCWLLPNVEYVNQPMISESDKPPSASFTAIPIENPQRIRLIGTVDDAWFQNQWPSLPIDTHPDFYQTAPKDQWFESYLEGGEPVEILNMHERFPLIKTKIPKVRYRFFVEKKHGDDFVVVEVPSRLETIILLPNQLSALMVQRAVLNLHSFDGSEIASITVAQEAVNSVPMPYEHYRQVFQQPELLDE